MKGFTGMTLLLFALLIGQAHSFGCYTCRGPSSGSCGADFNYFALGIDTEVKICDDGQLCGKATVTAAGQTTYTRACFPKSDCQIDPARLPAGSTLSCCAFNLCNGAGTLFIGLSYIVSLLAAGRMAVMASGML